MSPMLDVQSRGRELGRIRMGAVLVRDGKARPVKLETFRFTTPSHAIAAAVADLFGGDVEPWQPEGRAAEWQVLTDATELPVALPPGAPLTQWWELWTGAGCIRRCDGRTEQISGKPCMCPPNGPLRAEAAGGRNPTACKPTSRLSVILPDLPDLGIWLLASRGWHAAVELAGAADLLHRAATAGVLLPAKLRLEQRTTKRPGESVQHYAVPVLELGVTLRALTEGSAGVAVDQLPPAPPRARALTTSSAGGAPAQGEGAGSAPPADEDRMPLQALADLVREARTRTDLAVLTERAKTDDRLDDLVGDDDGVLVPLSDLIRTRWKALPE